MKPEPDDESGRYDYLKELVELQRHEKNRADTKDRQNKALGWLIAGGIILMSLLSWIAVMIEKQQ